MFTIVNKTNISLENIMNEYLDINSSHTSYLEDYNQTLSQQSYTGFIFDSLKNVTLLYNDSALFSVPLLVNKLTNFYNKIENKTLIKTTLQVFPATEKDINADTFDSSSFAALLVLGIAIAMPTVSFAVEIVHDKEVIFIKISNLINFKINNFFKLKCFNQLRIRYEFFTLFD
jgi:hypothetical protein